MTIAKLMHNTPSLTHTLGVLENAGHSAHLVGGAVRNALMGMPVSDLDIATSAHPGTVQALFEAEGCAVHPTGIEHGTLTVVVDDEPFEITTWRRDVETDGRRATIAFATSIGEDARRRDFTVNALYADARGAITDPTGQGLADIAARRIAFIDNPADRIREDALRILRFYRFSATHGMEIDPASPDANACRALGFLARNLPRERIGAEMIKLLAAPDPGSALAHMAADGLLDVALNGSITTRNPRKRILRLVMAEAELDLAPDAIRRLVSLVEEAPTDALRLSKADARRFRVLSSAARDDSTPRELGFRLGSTEARNALALRLALRQDASLADGDTEAINRGSEAVFPLNGGDLKGLHQGPALGAALKALEARWIASDFSLDRDALLALGPVET